MISYADTRLNNPDALGDQWEKVQEQWLGLGFLKKTRDVGLRYHVHTFHKQLKYGYRECLESEDLPDGFARELLAAWV
jgi:hypothetical protein